MILTNRIAHSVASGEVTVAYRRWTHPRVTSGTTFRTVAGIMRVDAVERTDPALLDSPAAQHAGYATVLELLTTLRGDDADPLWRITLSWVGPDPRDALADDAALSSSDIASIDALLDRLDKRTPWARATLTRIAERPGIVAAELAHELPLGKEPLKRRIRTLKEHGLTRSRTSGYELSPRGLAYLSATSTKRSAT